MANTPQPTPPQPPPSPAPPSPKPEDEEKERAAKAKKLFDDDEAKAKEDPSFGLSPELRRSAEMEEVGVAAWMAEQERRIQERQGEPPREPRQVHGVAAAQKPH